MAFKILVVEDDELMAGLLSRKLTNAGFTVTSAFDGESGLKNIEKEIPDIILLDLILPGINGFDFLSRVKKDEKTKNVPVIILSNLGSREEIQKGLEQGADDYLIKANVLIDEVISKISALVQKQKS